MGSSKFYCLVMAGGRGTRFWPESTSKKPKQYLKLVSSKTLLEESLGRFTGLVNRENRYVVTVKEQEELAKLSGQNEMDTNHIIFEPMGRNTAPCILLSLVHLLKSGADPQDVVAIVPSDHVILNGDGFRQTLGDAMKLASNEGSIVTIGIPPHFPHTGYGYIQKGDEVSLSGFQVEEFKEKPDFETAKKYLKSGNYLWNAGMFVSKIQTLVNEFEKHAKDIFHFFTALEDAHGDFSKISEIYGQMPKDSIDYAVMEKSENVHVIPAQFDWNDLGSWDALESVIEKRDNNVVASARDSHFINANNNIVYAPGKFVTLVDVDDLIVVSNDSTVMILPKSQSQKVKEVVEFLKDHDLGAELL